jgi:hypothetical protein
MGWVWWAIGGALVLGFNLGVLLMAAVSAGASAERIEQSAKRGNNGEGPGPTNASAWEERGWSPKDRELGIGS